MNPKARSQLAPAISFICLLAGTPVALAHDMKMAGVKVRLDATSVTVGVVAHLHQMGGVDPTVFIPRRLHLLLDGKPFAPSRVTVMRDPAVGVAMWQGTRAGAAQTVELDAPIFPEQPHGGTVLTVFHAGQVCGEALVDADHPRAIIGLQGNVEPVASVVARFVRLGVMHIFTGPDHMLFIFGLLLLGGTVRRLIEVVSAFTLAHSVTLSLAATGVFSLPSRIVEPLIALSIIAVAIENLSARAHARDNRPALAFGFGLIHGFGFAGALGEVGLPPHAIGWALASFNIGVELAQATIVLICAPALTWLARARPKASRALVTGGSLFVAAMGGFWFLQRVLGPG